MQTDGGGELRLQRSRLSTASFTAAEDGDASSVAVSRVKARPVTAKFVTVTCPAMRGALRLPVTLAFRVALPPPVPPPVKVTGIAATG